MQAVPTVLHRIHACFDHAARTDPAGFRHVRTRWLQRFSLPAVRDPCPSFERHAERPFLIVSSSLHGIGCGPRDTTRLRLLTAAV